VKRGPRLVELERVLELDRLQGLVISRPTQSNGDTPRASLTLSLVLTRYFPVFRIGSLTDGWRLTGVFIAWSTAGFGLEIGRASAQYDKNQLFDGYTWHTQCCSPLLVYSGVVGSAPPARPVIRTFRNLVDCEG